MTRGTATAAFPRPYAAVNAHMTERIYAGSGDIPWVTGTIVRLGAAPCRVRAACRRAAHAGRLLPARGLSCGGAALHPCAAACSGQLILSILRCEQNGHEQLLPSTRSRSGTAMPLSCRRRSSTSAAARLPSAAATDSSSRARATPSIHKGNMASSGSEIRLNGRAAAHRLLARSTQHTRAATFLARVDLQRRRRGAAAHGDDEERSWRPIRARRLSMLSCARMWSRLPPRPRAGKEPVEQLAAKLRAEPDVLRVARGPHLSLHRPQEPDRFQAVGRADGATIFEAKDEATFCARSLSAALVLGRVCARRCAGARGRTDRLQAPRARSSGWRAR